jgi:hypothetical protein
MVGGFCGKKKGYSANDNFYTPKSEWEAIAHLLPKEKVLWEAFYGDGKSGEYLRELGFKVIHQQEDFFEHNKGDIVVSNPPFSKKREIIERLKTLDKPFLLLMPYEVLFTKYFEPFKKDICLIFPKNRVNFIKEKELKKFNFQCIWFAWKMDLPKLTFL